ncbi:TIGR00730 family Rossman fold protein [Sandaracinobacter sp. RS1-74]|uniref:LOG family protein n=1 Tax=Sandaracinobacteroides sayramensis TaxID=2913411 RepID=UPI001EDB76EB|nr:TIGR00730 family Rossman fold protein [Sandaracinobacteroides sayramensis]MCG2840305.1 TIGR00730 family Rossman fold protein [Sandaracinobacteroides sayramensis]
MPGHPLDSPSPPLSDRPIRHVLLFCGSRTERDPRHAALAAGIGRLLAQRGVALVYGGGARGLMGEAGRAAIAAGGEVEGIIPRFLKDWEVAEPLCEQMIVTDSLHARKALMFEHADAVLALPGGLGTLDELIEVLSWRSLRLHAKPVWLMGDGDFWAPFLHLLRHAVAEGFAGPDILTFVECVNGTDALAALLPHP